jgi:hypothetical protein
MERSRVTVEYRHLHQQVFEHEVEGVHCVVQTISGGVPEHLTVAQALDAVQSRLAQWPGTTAGFTLPVTDYADSFRLVVPAVVEWDLWPRVYSCDSCGLVLQTNENTPLERSCHRCHRGIFRQLPYYRVHRCGRRRLLAVPRCTADADHPVAFHDSGSFVTAYFTCLTCHTRLEINAGNCCDLGGTLQAAPDRRYRLVRARDSKAFYGHHVTVVNITARLARALSTPRGPLWAFAHYLGHVTNLDGLVDEAQGRTSPGATQDTDMQRILEIVNATPNLSDDDRARLAGTINSKRGEEPGLEAASHLLSAAVIEQGRTDRRLIERAFIFHERRPEDLADVEARYRAGGHNGMAARMATGRSLAHELGFAKVAVVRELPIAMVAFGFTREFSDFRARLQPLEPPERERAAKRPLVTIESNTEGIYFELDPVRLWSWCETNGWTSGAPPADSAAARAWLAATTYEHTPGPAALAVQRLTHAWAHTLIHALEGRSAFGPASVAEYLFERLGGVLLYVANYSTFNLGGLTTVTEQHLADWLDAAREQTICVHDPICLTERGGCHKCLALAFHCERFNRGLHRGYLLGSQDPAVREGWLLHAATHASSP